MENIEMENETEFIKAFRKLKQLYAWRGTIDERKQKFLTIHNELNAIYNQHIELKFVDVNAENDKISGSSRLSAYVKPFNTLVIHRKLSVITFMQLWMRIIGLTPENSVKKSDEIFKLVFPVSAKKLIQINGLFVQYSDNNENNDPENDNISDFPPVD